MRTNSDDDQIKQANSPAVADEQSSSGSTPDPESDDDVGKMMEEVIGNEPDPRQPFSLDQEMQDDERAMHEIPPDEANLKGQVEDTDPFSES